MGQFEEVKFKTDCCSYVSTVHSDQLGLVFNIRNINNKDYIFYIWDRILMHLIYFQSFLYTHT